MAIQVAFFAESGISIAQALVPIRFFRDSRYYLLRELFVAAQYVQISDSELSSSFEFRHRHWQRPPADNMRISTVEYPESGIYIIICINHYSIAHVRLVQTGHRLDLVVSRNQ
ncbi:hypothetical protein D3C78_1633100 [compost metagenome]